MKKVIIFGFIIGVFTALGIIGRGYYVEMERQNFEDYKVQSLDKCMQGVQEGYKNEWNQTCELHGMEAGCSLNVTLSERLEKHRYDEMESCRAMYNVYNGENK